MDLSRQETLWLVWELRTERTPLVMHLLGIVDTVYDTILDLPGTALIGREKHGVNSITGSISSAKNG